LDKIEKKFQENMGYVRCPEKCLLKIKQKIEKVRSDEASMELLKAASKVVPPNSTENDEPSERSADNVGEKADD
jgi:hypothetical protein